MRTHTCTQTGKHTSTMNIIGSRCTYYATLAKCCELYKDLLNQLWFWTTLGYHLWCCKVTDCNCQVRTVWTYRSHMAVTDRDVEPTASSPIIFGTISLPKKPLSYYTGGLLHSVVDMLLLADLHNAANLKKNCLNFIYQNLPEVCLTSQWKQLKQQKKHA